MEAISSIGSWLGSATGKGVLGAGAAGGGLIQNILANREAQKKQSFVENLITDPKKWNAFVASKEQPLAAGLTADVARSTDAYGAERGLGSSPAIMKDVYAQALAPYIQNEQQMAQNAAINSLGIYGNMPTTRPADITSLLKLFMQPPNGAVRQGPSPINAGPPTVSQSGGYGGWVGPTQDAPQGDPGVVGSVPGQQPFDYSSLIDQGVLGG